MLLLLVRIVSLNIVWLVLISSLAHSEDFVYFMAFIGA